MAKDKEKSSFKDDFKAFIMRGNVIDLAVGVVIGGAFGKIVTSLVEDIIMPLIGMLLGKVDFSNLSWKVGSANVKYGMFIQNIVNFLIISLVIFTVIRLISKLHKKEEAKEEVPAKSEEQKTLEEIRDILKKKN